MGKEPKDSQSCRFCNKHLDENSIYGNTIICSSCHGTYTLKRSIFDKHGGRLFSLLMVVTLLASALWVYDQGLLDRSDTAKRRRFIIAFQKKIDTYSFLEVKGLIKRCEEPFFIECRLLVFKRLSELEPTDTGFRANYAFMLTRSSKHKEANKIYKDIIKNGEGTFDVMAYHGLSLKAEGKYQEAISWFKSALKLSPDLSDITQELAASLIKVGKPQQAASLVKSFITKYPDAKGYFTGTLESIKETNKKEAK